MALSASAVGPKVLDNLQVLAISPDGKTIVSSWEEVLTIYNVETDESVEFQADVYPGYTVGSTGQAFSNDGIMVGSTPEGAAYYKNGEWTVLSCPNPELGNFANSITPDGSMIVGTVGMSGISVEDTRIPMQVPAIWERKPDGTYGDAVVLPYPAKDFSGRVPQYVTALVVSADGKKVAGQVQDYSGWMNSAITYEKGADGEWTYNTAFDVMCNPNHLTFPEYPGDAPESPQLIDFMTEEEKAAYNAAVEEWYALGTYDYETYPNENDYISAEGKAAYEAAMAEWQVVFNEWSVKYNAFDEVFAQCVKDGRPTVFNNLFLSDDGKTLFSVCEITVEDPNSYFGTSQKYTPVKMTIEDAAYDVYPVNNISISSVAADNTLFGFTTTEETVRQAMVYLPNQKEPLTLIEYYEAYVPGTADWIKENMTHDLPSFDMETGEETTIPDYPCTGTPFVTPDCSVLATGVANMWDYSGADIFTYILPSASAAVKNVADDNNFKVSALKGGRILVAGEACDVAVYDMSGRMVFRAASASGVVNTGLVGGPYIVKAVSAGDTKVLKTTF